MDKAPENLSVGAINPYALTEALTGRKFNWSDPGTAKIIADVLEKDYDELFDMKFNSPIYAGLKLNAKGFAEPLKAKEIITRKENAPVAPDLSNLKTVADLEKTGIRNASKLEVKNSQLTRGNLTLKLRVPELANSLSNTTVSKLLFEYTLPYHIVELGWTPPNATWKDMGDFFKDVTEYNDPIQGAIGNCYFIAAMAAIAWATPYDIVHRNRATGTTETSRTNAIQFYTKGGGKDAPTKLVEVTDSTIVNSSSFNPIYCRSNDGGEIWPALYEKAFAKWITQVNYDHADITQTAYGDPAKATAQLNGKTPYYYNTDTRTGEDLYQLVRGNSLSYKTINPMTAWTYGSGRDYSGSNIVGNHAYTILGWSYMNNKKYIILRNPWGVTEPAGLNTYQGLLSFFDKSFWRPITTIGNDGVFALEADSFQYYFACVGVAK